MNSVKDSRWLARSQETVKLGTQFCYVKETTKI